MLRIILLGLLQYRPMTGYEIKTLLDVSINHFWHAKLSQVYTTLKQLEGDGLLTSRVEAQDDRPDRRTYSVTEAGRAAFHDWQLSPIVEPDPLKFPFLVWVFFAAQAPPAVALTQLRLMRDLHRQRLHYYQHTTPDVIQDVAETTPASERDIIFWEATRRFGEAFEANYLRWMDELITQLEREIAP